MIERELRPGGRLYEIREWGNKLGGLLARIAGVLHMAEHSGRKEPWAVPVTVETMSSAIRLGDYFAGHASAAFGLLGISGSLATGSALWETIVRRGFTRFSHRDLHQAVYKQYRGGQVAEGLAVLEELNYVRHVAVPGPGTQGGRPKSPLYEVNPRAAEPDNGPSGGFDPFDGFDSRYSSDYPNDDGSPVKGGLKVYQRGGAKLYHGTLQHEWERYRGQLKLGPSLSPDLNSSCCYA